MSSGSPAARRIAWHAVPGAVERFLGDLISHEMKRLRPGMAPPAHPWNADLAIGVEGLGLDSLEHLEVVAAVAEALHLHEAGTAEPNLGATTFGDWVRDIRRALDCFDARLTFRTSGSTGTPKRCTHALADLDREIDHWASTLAPLRRVVTALPSHHIYGFLFSLMLPAALGIRDVIDARTATPQALTRLLEPGDLLISHPTHWALVARHAGTFPHGVVGVTSSAPCPPELARALIGPGIGLQRLIQVYGSSETAGVGWRDHPDAPYELLPHWIREASSDSMLGRRDAAGNLSTHSLQDNIEWRGERRFDVVRRTDEAVQVGGVNVHPQRVRDLLMTHPAWSLSRCG